MNYEDMSDNELDVKLNTFAMGSILDGFTYNPNGKFFVKPVKDGFPETWSLVEYCSDWNAIMPLAVEHGISLMKSGNEWHAGLANFIDGCWEFEESSRGELVDFESYDLDPLRAIVICLIKVMESKEGE